MKGKWFITSAARNPMLSFLFDEFQVKNRVRNLSSATIKGYQETFNRFSTFIGQDIVCNTVSVKTVEPSSSNNSMIESSSASSLK